MTNRTMNGIFTSTITRRFYAPLPLRNSWWDTKCWLCRNGHYRRGKRAQASGMPGCPLFETMIVRKKGLFRSYGRFCRAFGLFLLKESTVLEVTEGEYE